MKVRVFTDGACSDNPGPGGWAAVFNTATGCETIQGYEVSTTNNRMELMAIIKSLEEIFKNRKTSGDEFEFYCDSAYVLNAINNRWIEVWEKNGWKTVKGEDVKNKDLWKEFLFLRKRLFLSKVKLRFIKIRGHSGNTFNEMVDKLAKEEIFKAKKEIKAGDHK